MKFYEGKWFEGKKQKWTKLEKMTKSYEIQSSGTKVQIFKSCGEPQDEDLRALGVNWMKIDVKGIKFRQNMIINQFPTEKLCSGISVSYWDPFLT